MPTRRVLLIEDNPAHAKLVERLLARGSTGFSLEWVDCLGDGLRRLEQGGVDAVLLDLGLPDSEREETLPRVLAKAPDVPVIVLTTADDLDAAVRSVQQGAQDDLPKGQLGGELLVRSLRYAIERKQSEEQLRRLNATLEERVAERTAVAEERAEKLRFLASELSQAEHVVRRRLAQALHDNHQQILVAAKMRTDVLQNRIHGQDEALDKVVAQIGDLLDQAIDSARTLTLDLSPPVLADRGLAAALDWLTRRMRDQHHLTVELAARGDDSRLAEGGAAFLFEAARELLFNIVKHAGVDRARVELDCTGEEAVLSVEDHGKGFDPTVLKDQAFATEHFGLFSVRERLALMGGSVRIRSEAGRGTTITLLTPYATGNSVPAEPVAREPAATPSSRTPRPCGRDTTSDCIRIVIVDDHQILREGLASMLSAEPDLEVVGQAADAETGLRLIEDVSPDVVVMDVSLPGMSGIAATQAIVKAWSDIRVVGLSMHDPQDLAAAMRNAGAAAFLSKAGPGEELLASIRAGAEQPGAKQPGAEQRSGQMDGVGR